MSQTIGKYNIVSMISLPVKTGPCWRHGQNIVLKRQSMELKFLLRHLLGIRDVISMTYENSYILTVFQIETR